MAHEPHLPLRALIVGGGISGLTTALALRRIGIEVAVYEQAPRLRAAGAGLVIWANAVRALRTLGVTESLITTSPTIERIELRTVDGRVLSATPIGAIARSIGIPSISVHRAELLTALATALPPEAIHVGAKCVGIKQDEAGVTAHFADGATERADLLVGADGLHSIVRAHVLGPAKPRYAGYTAWRGVATVPTSQITPGTSFEAVGYGQRFGMMPLGPERVYWYATRNAPEQAADMADPQKPGLLEQFKAWHAPIPAVIAATDESSILRNDIYDRPPTKRWGAGRITLVGDAAHPMTPNIGQGACLAIEDAVVLAASLRANANVAAALRDYEARRYARTTWVTNQSWQLGLVLQWSNPLACALRDVAIRLAPASATTRQFTTLLQYNAEHAVPSTNTERHSTVY